MSDRLGTAYVEIEPDFSQFNRNVQSGVREASRTIDRELTRTLNNLEGDFADFADDALSEVRTAFDRIATAGEDSASEVEFAYEDAESAIRTAFERAQSSARTAFAGIERDATNSLNEISAEARQAGNDVESSFRDTGTGIGSTIGQGTDEASGGFLGMADAAAGAGLDIRGSMQGAAGKAGIGAIVIAAVAAIEAFIDMGREALELEGNIIRVSQATDSGFSPEAVSEFREALRGLQTEYGILTNELIPALDTAISQGVPEDNVISFLETAAQSAIVTGSDLTDTVSVINGLMAQFEGEFADAGEAADFLTTTLSNTNAEAADIGDVFGEVSGFARNAGLGVDEVSAAFAAMSVTGRDAGTSGGQLAALIEELGDSTTPVAEAFNELSGQSFPEFIAQGGSLQEAAQLISDGADDAGKSVVELASSAETSSAILALSTEQGAARFEEALGDVQDAAGRTGESFGEIEESGALAFSQLEGSFATLRDTAGEAVAPIIAEFLDGLIPAVEEVSPLLSTVGEILLTALSVAIEFLTPLIELFFMLFESVSPVLEILTPLFEILGLIGEIVGSILTPVFSVLLAHLNPIFEVIGMLLTPAVGLLSLGLEKLSSLISTYVSPFLTRLAGNITASVAPALTWLSSRIEFAKTAFGALINFVSTNWGRATSAIGNGINRVKSFFSDLVGDVKSALNVIIDGWNRLSFTVPSVDLGPLGSIGGFTVSLPDIPRLETGGFTTAEGIAMLHPNEMVLPLTNSNGINALADAMREAGAGSGEGGNTTIIVKIGERELTDIVDTQVSRNNRTLTRRARAGTGRNS